MKGGAIGAAPGAVVNERGEPGGAAVIVGPDPAANAGAMGAAPGAPVNAGDAIDEELAPMGGAIGADLGVAGPTTGAAGRGPVARFTPPGPDSVGGVRTD